MMDGLQLLKNLTTYIQAIGLSSAKFQHYAEKFERETMAAPRLDEIKEFEELIMGRKRKMGMENFESRIANHVCQNTLV